MIGYEGIVEILRYSNDASALAVADKLAVTVEQATKPVVDIIGARRVEWLRRELGSEESISLAKSALVGQITDLHDAVSYHDVLGQLDWCIDRLNIQPDPSQNSDPALP